MVQLKTHIISEIQSINSPTILGKLLDFLSVLKQSRTKPQANGKSVLALAGTLSNQDAMELENLIHEEFNEIEGEW